MGSKYPIDTQVFTHLLAQMEVNPPILSSCPSNLTLQILTAIISACERLLRTPVPLGYNIAISRIVWIFVFALPSQLWFSYRYYSILITVVTAYALFALAEVGIEIENPWGEGPNDLDLDRYCNLLALDLDDIMTHPQTYQTLESPLSSSRETLIRVESFENLAESGALCDPISHGYGTMASH
jgi:putative membrane protein